MHAIDAGTAFPPLNAVDMCVQSTRQPQGPLEFRREETQPRVHDMLVQILPFSPYQPQEVGGWVG